MNAEAMEAEAEAEAEMLLGKIDFIFLNLCQKLKSE